MNPICNNNLNTTNNNKFNKNKKLSIKWRSLIYTIMFIKKSKKRVKKSRYRMNILRQWVKTQQSYKQDLTIALSKIRQPLIDKSLIDSQQAKIICSDFQSMIYLSNFMLQILHKNMQIKTQKKSRIFQSNINLNPQDGVLQINPNNIKIGAQLCKIAEGYKTYGSFFGNHSKCEKLLIRLNQQNHQEMKGIQKDFQDYLKTIDAKKQNMTVKDCLQQPLYRLFKYVLLMKQYLKRLPHNHPDYQQLHKAHQIFQEINHANNDLMRVLQGQQKKIKLQKLLGKTLQGSMSYIAEMQANTIEFKVKVYIFNTFIVLSKNQSGILAKEEKYMTLQLDQFSFIAEQNDMKYFKNILSLTGKHTSVHLFFSDPGSKMQLYNCVNKVIKQLRLRSSQRRKLIGNQKKVGDKKIKFTLEDDKPEIFCFQPGFRIQVLNPQVRPLSNMTNQTVYTTRFMLPEFVQDWKNFIRQQRQRSTGASQSQRISLGQHGKIDPELQSYLNMPKGTVWLNYSIDLHLSQLQALQKIVKTKNSTAQLPPLNPLTKDLNIYSDGRKKTRAYEARCFFIEQYLNTIFRHPTIMINPVQIIKKLRVQEALWDYVIDRNEKTFNTKEDKIVTFGMKHCDTCTKAIIDSLQQFEHYRKFFRRSYAPQPLYPPKQKYCLNFYNIARIKMLTQFPAICFNTLERVLTNIHYSQGRIDYPFIKRLRNDPYKMKIYLPGVQLKNMELTIYDKTTAGQVIQQIAYLNNIDSLFDFALFVQYYDRQRVIGWDQYIADIVKQLKVKIDKMNNQNNQNKQQKSFFTTFKQWGRDLFTESDGRITLKKYVFLTKQLQIKSLNNFPNKYQFIIEQIFYQVKNLQILLPLSDLADLSGFYYILKQRYNLHKFISKESLNHNVLKGLLPNFCFQKLNDSQFSQKIYKKIKEHKQKYSNGHINEINNIYNSVVNIVIQNESFSTYFVPVQIHTVEDIKLNKSSSDITPFLGVNLKQIILIKNKGSSQTIFRFPLSQVTCSVSVYSIFLNYENRNYRLDGKMFNGFHQLLLKYQLIRKKFPHYSI